jgi:hypothetical protein
MMAFDYNPYAQQSMYGYSSPGYVQPSQGSVQPQGSPDYHVIWKNRIILGNAAAAENPRIMRDIGVTHILNMAAEMPTHFNDPNYPYIYKHIPMRDEETEDISPWLSHMYYFIDEAVESGGRVYVHCHMGVSRGATAVIYYIMIKRDWSFEKTFQYVKQRRPQIAPNFGYACGVLHFVYTGAGPSQNAPVRVPHNIVMDEMLFVARTYINGGISRSVVERAFADNGNHIENTLRSLRSSGGHYQGNGRQMYRNGYGYETPKRRSRSIFDILSGR